MERMMKKLVCFVCVFCLCLALAVPTWAADGNPLANAKSIGTSGTVQGTITDENKAEYYRYTVPSGSSVELKIKYSTDMNYSEVCVLDSDGNELDYEYVSNNGDTGKKTENVSFLLNPGAYYIGIRRDMWSNGTYSMNYTTNTLYNTDVTYDDTIAAAHALPLTTNVNGILSKASGDEIDLYKLNVTNPGVLNYNIKFDFRNMDFKLLDKDGNEIKSWDFSWNGNLKMGTESFEIPLESGTYYLEVLRDGYDGKYSFSQTYTDIGSTEKEPDDTMESAQELNLGQKVTGLIAIGGDTDFYKINVPSRRNITFSLPSKIDDTYLYIYDEDGNEIKWCYGSWNDNTQKSTLRKIYKLPAGTYYVQVKGEYSSYSYGKYNLTVATTKAPTQVRITTLKKTKKDWWGNRSIYFKLGKSYNAEGYLIYVAKNSKFRGASKYVADSRSFRVGPLSKGKTYYVKVRGYSKNSDGEYIYGKFSKVRKVRL